MKSGAGAPSRQAAALLALALFGTVAVGRLAHHAWLERPTPRTLPEIGATTKTARPFLIVILDGLRAAVAWDENDVSMPWLQHFARRGAWGVGMAGDPTLTAPCVRAILTGRAPDLVSSFHNFDMEPVGGTVLGYLAERGARLVHGGDAAIYQMVRPWVREGDAYAVPDQGPTDFTTDAKAVRFVLGKISEGADVVSLHLTRPDHTGHLEGASGRPYRAACTLVDGETREVVEAFLARHPDGLVLVSADHGVTPMGTHGGGELEPRRAPFALVGPGVARVGPVEVSQFALAPTIATLLGLPMPPLADAPPAPVLMALPASRVRRAMDAYLRARLAVAKGLGVGGTKPIEGDRERLAARLVSGDVGAPYRALAATLNRLLEPSSIGPALLVVLLTGLWTFALVRLASARVLASPAVVVLALLAAALALPSMTTFPPVVVAALLAALSLFAWGTARSEPPRSALLALAGLALLASSTAAGLALSTGVQAAESTPGGATPALLFLAGVGALWIGTTRLKGLGARVRRALIASPALLPALGGMAIGFLLTLRPFLNPVLVDYRVVFTVLGILVLVSLARSRGAGPSGTGVRVLLLVLGILLLLPPRIADMWLGGSWLDVIARRETLWLLGGLALVLLLPWAARRTGLGRRDAPALVLSVLALVLAYAVRLDPSPGAVEARAAVLLGLLALVASLRGGSPDGRLLARLLAVAALGRRLTGLDGEFLAFALFLLGCAVASRLPLPRSRLRIAAAAVGLLVLRSAVHHALGGVDSFSTVDVAGGFVGLGHVPAKTVSEGAGLSWPIVEAIFQLSLRFALPWIALLAAAGRMLGEGAALRRLLGDLAVGYAMRGAAIAVILWAWWRSAWWTDQARTVFALGAAELVLLVAASLLAGGFTEPRLRDGEVRDAGITSSPAPTCAAPPAAS